MKKNTKILFFKLICALVQLIGCGKTDALVVKPELILSERASHKSYSRKLSLQTL